MADTIPLDINEILSSFAAENAAATQRAIIAEAGVKARDKAIAELKSELEAQALTHETQLEERD